MNRTHNRSIGIALLVAMCGLTLPAGIATAAPLDVRKIADLAKLPASITADGVVRLAWPRTDVAVKVGGMTLKPFAGLTTWAALAPSGRGAILTGDTIVFADEIDAALDAALAAGLDVTALHIHSLYDEPRVYSMHIGGEASPEKLVIGVKNIWDAIKIVRIEHPQPATAFDGKPPLPGRVDGREIERIVRHKVETQDGVVKVTISRDAILRGMKVTSTMGLATWAAFAGDDRLAAMDGEFILTADEVQPILQALRKAGIHVVALHNDLIGEQPQFYFANFWGQGKCEDLAKAFAAALTAQKDASKPGRIFK